MTYLKFVNNLPISTFFADDAKLFKHVICDEDHKALQLGLNALQDWSNKWLLKLNILKCKTVFFERNINKNYTKLVITIKNLTYKDRLKNYTYSLQGTQLERLGTHDRSRSDI